MKKWRMGTSVIVTGALALFLASGAFAGKPKPPPPPPPPPPIPVDTGVVYFETASISARLIETMNPDGSAKTVLWTGETWGPAFQASRDLHGGRRWILHLR